MTFIDGRAVTPVPVRDAFEWATQSIDASGIGSHAAALARDAIDNARSRLAGVQLPDSWIPMDLDPDNVLVDEDGSVRFIDLDDSFFGPAPLAIATLARRIRRAVRTPEFPALTRVLYRAYGGAWPDGALAHCPWRSVEIASVALDAYLGWRRIRRSEELGEITGAVEFARLRAGRPLVHAILKLATQSERR
jgi:hypothetical protein